MKTSKRNLSYLLFLMIILVTIGVVYRITRIKPPEVSEAMPQETTQSLDQPAQPVPVEPDSTALSPGADIPETDTQGAKPELVERQSSRSPILVPASSEGGVPATLQFSNQTDTALGEFTHATPITEGDGAQMISGAAAGDFNNDGWVDLYVIGGGLRADSLYINQGVGKFVDMAEAAGLAEPHLGSGAAVGDYNNDGWLDIFVTSFGPPDAMGAGQHLLFRNNGDLTFTNVAEEMGVNRASPELADGLGAAFGDYDLDGDLDLFVSGWRKPEGQPAMGNRLFTNNGTSFTDVTDTAGIVDDGIRGFNPCFADTDGDRYPELLLSADFGTSRYYRNNTDGTYNDATNQAGTYVTWSGMGSAVGDVNNDGMLDWFITAIYDDDGVGRGLGNTLYLNQGNHLFKESAALMGVDDGGWGWGTEIVDLNNDGLPDIIAVNGWDLKSYLDEAAKVWLQQPDGTFIEVAVDSGLDEGRNELGLLTLDYDNDGDQDVLITAYNGDLRLYRNDLDGPQTHWLRVVLDTNDSTDLAPNGIGSRVQIRIGEYFYTRYVLGCSHYLTQSELAVHFGLGAVETIDELIVDWPNGSVTTLTDLDADQIIVISP